MRLRETQLVLPLYILASVAFTWPLALAFSRAIPSGRVAFDPCMQAFILGWDWHSIRSNLLGVFHAPIFYPEPNTLTYMDHLLGETLATLPVLALTGSIAAAYNLLFIGSFAASAWTTYRLVRLLGVSRFGAFLAGSLFAFSPYRCANLDLLNQLQTQFLPLGLLFGVRYLRRYRARDLIGIAGTFVVQVYFGWYYAYYLALALAVLVLYSVATDGLELRNIRWAHAAGVALCAALIVLPVSLPYAWEHRALPEFRRSLGESALYSADVLDYLAWNRNALLAKWMPFAAGPQSYWPGLATVLLAAAGAWKMRSPARRWGREGYFLVLSAVSFVLSLGPILHVAHVRVWIPLPYAALYYILPGVSNMRAPARLASLALLGLVVLAGLGWDRLRRGRIGRLRGDSRLLSGALLLIAIASAWPRPLSVVELPSPRRMPPVYAWLAGEPGAGPILEVPLPARDADESETHALRQYCALFHGRPRLDGTSGFVSRRYREFRLVAQSFPDDRSLSAAAAMGARQIIVHFGDFAPEQRAALRLKIEAQRRLKPVARFNADAVYQLDANAGSPSS